MATAKRYSGHLTITVRLDDFDDYKYTVSHRRKVLGRGTTRAPASGFFDPKTRERVAHDSAVAFDQVVHAALSFASDDAKDGDVIGDLADFTDSGYAISRRKPARKAASNGSSESLTAAEWYALARFAAEHGRTWKSKLLRMRANSSAFPVNHPVLYSACNRIGPSGIKSLRLAETNGRSRLKRTKLACARRARATRKGSSKAASRLAKYCPKRRSRKAK